MNRLIFISICLFLLHDADAQKTLGKISSINSLNDFYAISFNDSILVSYHENLVSGARFKRTQWVRPDGTLRNDNFPTDIFYIGQFEGSIYYYFFNETGKRTTLKAHIQKQNAISRNESPDNVPIEGVIIGGYLEHNLFLLTYIEETNQIKVTEINGVKVVNEKRYTLPVPFSKHFGKQSGFEFFGTHSMLNTFKGWAKVKVYRYQDLYITLDVPASPSNTKNLYTQVFILNSESESVEQITFPEVSKDDFRSFVVDSKLFRSVISKAKFSLDVYDLESKELIAHKEILNGQDNFDTYFRHGKECQVSQEIFARMLKVSESCQPSLVVLGDSTKYLIQWGTYFDEKGVIFVSPFSLIGLATMFIGTAVLQMGDGPGVSRYFYYEWDPVKQNFVLNKTPNNTRNRIDRYELDLAASKPRLRYKKYVTLGNGLLAIYYDYSKKTATFVQFD